MTATTRQFVSALLSLLLVINGPALAMSKIADSQAGVEMADCGSMMMARLKTPVPHPDTESNCVSAPDMACPSTSGLGKCGVSVSFALLPGSSIGFTDTGSQPVLTARATLYQDPFLASITPLRTSLLSCNPDFADRGKVINVISYNDFMQKLRAFIHHGSLTGVNQMRNSKIKLAITAIFLAGTIGTFSVVPAGVKERHDVLGRHAGNGRHDGNDEHDV
ncbi:MAG: hypothetical protein MH213_12240 [Marinobacter sp.]|nr:hypothetical protein [Marinobacter sp.]